MKRAMALICLLLAAVASPARAAEPSETAGVKAAEAWLQLIDTGRYGASWDEASTLFRKAVSRSAWETQAAVAREPLGKVVSRKIASKQLTHQLPGAPDGTYVVVVYNTRFVHKERAHETVTVMLEDGRFRGAGYFIR
jgi:uncharacterized protein DUF4019